MKKSIYIALLVCLAITGNVFAQQRLGYIGEDLPADSMTASLRTHTAVKPYILPGQAPFSRAQLGIGSYGTHSKILVRPLADLNAAYRNSFGYRAGGGLEVESAFNRAWYFRASAVAGSGKTGGTSIRNRAFFYEPQANGQYNYLDVRGRVSYTPNHIFDFQAGLDQQFIGEGCRSLLLSDYGKPYPFAMLRANFWRVDYSVIYQFFHEHPASGGIDKFAATHYLSLNATRWLNIGIFETVLFQPRDGKLNRGFEAEYLNPVIFYRPQEYSLGSSDNVLLGMQASARIGRNVLYGQLMLDEFFLAEIRASNGWWANKFAVQAGIKGRTGKHLFWRGEFNMARPYTYAHISSGLNYGQMGMPLAHPLGANFAEVLAELKWQKRSLLLKLFASYTRRGYDPPGSNYGSDIYQSYVSRPYDYGHYIGQGISRNSIHLMLSGSYRIDRASRLNCFAEVHFRTQGSGIANTWQAVVGLRSALWNDYRNY